MTVTNDVDDYYNNSNCKLYKILHYSSALYLDLADDKLGACWVYFEIVIPV